MFKLPWIAVLVALPLAAATGWKAGMAEISITPRQSIWMAGYAARKDASEGTAQELHAKALVLQDQNGRRVVLITTDMLGFPRDVARAVTERLRKQYGFARDRVLLNSSHTHTGPVVDRMLAVAYDLTPAQWTDIDAYTSELEDKVVAVVGQALGSMSPARLSFGRTEATFGANRRTPDGPHDPDVPLLRIDSADGRLCAIVFGYACHNTTLEATFCKFHGDYAGTAQQWLEKRHPGAVAFFVQGCGADINPKPRGTLELAVQHGEALASAVDRTLATTLSPISGPLRTAYEEFPLAFATPPTREELTARLQSSNRYERKHAQELLKILDRDGHLPATYPYPLEVWQFGSDLTFVAMGGEVVTDYVLRLKKELGPERLWVAGYSNDVMAYIPSLRVLKEGGYEGGGAMIYYVQPGPWAPTVEETIVGKVHKLVGRVRR